MQSKGVRVEEARIDWPELMQFKRTFTEPVPKQTEQWMAKSGIATLHGRARFVGPAAIQVGDDVLEAAKMAVAAGAKPIDLAIPGAELAVTSEQFLELDNLEDRLVFIGGRHTFLQIAHCAPRRRAPVSV